MRIRQLLCALAVGAVPATAVGQQRLSLDASVGAGGDAARAAVGVWRSVLQAPLGVRVRAGLRMTGYVAMSSPYKNRGTVQGNLTSELSIDPGVVGVNMAIEGELPVGSVALGANLDLVGFATGATWTQGSLEGNPESPSYFQYGTADRGALNSEFYVGLTLSARFTLRAGASHYVTDYSVTDTGASGQPSARYQRFETVPFAALRIGL